MALRVTHKGRVDLNLFIYIGDGEIHSYNGALYESDKQFSFFIARRKKRIMGKRHP